jgi:hypothetical protein
VGNSAKYEGNFGPGYYWPADSSYYFTDLGYNPYRFDDIPDRLTYSLYASDTWKSKFLGRDFTLVPGLRMDVFGIPTASNNDFGLANSNLNVSPRISFLYKLTPTTQIRADGGLSVKQPSIGEMYRPPTWIFDRSNPDLKAYQQENYNFSIDKELSRKVGISLNLYYKHIYDDIVSRTHPYHAWPDTIRNDSTYDVYENLGFSYTRGMEFTIVASRIGDFNFETNISYSYSYSGGRGWLYNVDPDPDPAKNEAWRYKPGNSWRKRLLLDYSIDYKAKPLGVWIKITAQQHPLDWSKSLSYTGISTYNNQWQKYADVRGFDVKGDYWLFNLQLSKSLYWGSEISLRVNNFPDNWGYVYDPYQNYWTAKNSPLYFSFEFSTTFGQ